MLLFAYLILSVDPFEWQTRAEHGHVYIPMQRFWFLVTSEQYAHALLLGRESVFWGWQPFVLVGLTQRN